MKVLALSAVIVFTGLASGQAALALQPAEDDGLREIASCRQVTKARDRLRCFDRATAFLEPEAVAASTPAGEDNVEPPSFASVNDAEPDGAETSSVSAAPAPGQAAPADGDAIDPVASFGAEDLVPEDREQQLKELRAVATSISTDRRGKFIIELDNGQIWRQLSGDTKTLRVRPDKDVHEVIIKKRSLGAYALRLTSAKRSILVRRVR